MKVLQIGYLDPYTNYGGVERYILNLSSSLHEEYGIEVDIICASKKAQESRTECGKLISLKVPFVILLAKVFYAISICNYLRKNADNYDIIHFPLHFFSLCGMEHQT